MVGALASLDRSLHPAPTQSVFHGARPGADEHALHELHTDVSGAVCFAVPCMGQPERRDLFGRQRRELTV
jgi:hypothetical protein